MFGYIKISCIFASSKKHKLINSLKTYTMLATTQEQRKEFMITNHTTKSLKQMAEELKFPYNTLKAEFIWLVRLNIVNSVKNVKLKKNINPNIIIDNDTDFDTTIDNFAIQVKALYKKNKNTYTNNKGLNKDKARTKWVNEIIKSGVTGNLISLMNTEVSGEREILQALPNMQITGVECDKPTLNQLRQVIKKANLPIKTNYNKVSALMYGFDSNHYAHMILDYCGCLSTHSNELEYAIQRNLLEVNGILALTICTQMRNTQSKKAQEILGFDKTISNVENYENINFWDKVNLTYINKLIGFNYELVEHFNYQDTKTPMSLFLIKRIK